MLRRLLALLILGMLVPSCLGETVCVTAGGMAALISDSGAQVLADAGYTDSFALIPGELFAFGHRDQEHSSYEIIRADGVRLTQESYDMIAYQNGVLLYRQGHHYGALDRAGRELLPAVYTQLATADGKHFLAILTDPYDDEPDQVYLVEPEGEPAALGLRLESGLDVFCDGRMRWQDADTELYGFLDGEGNAAIPALYEAAGAFSGGLAKVCSGGKYGVIDAAGRLIVPCRYDHIEHSDELILAISAEGQIRLLDAASGRELFLLEEPHSSAWLCGCLLAVSGAEDTRLFDASGHVVYTGAPRASICEGVDGSAILMEGLWGEKCAFVAGRDGTIWERREQQLLPCGALYIFATFRAAAYISSELGEIRYSCDQDSLRYGLLDEKGEEIVPARYRDIRLIGKDRYLLVEEFSWRVVDGAGAIVWSFSQGDGR